MSVTLFDVIIVRQSSRRHRPADFRSNDGGLTEVGDHRRASIEFSGSSGPLEARRVFTCQRRCVDVVRTLSVRKGSKADVATSLARNRNRQQQPWHEDPGTGSRAADGLTWVIGRPVVRRGARRPNESLLVSRPVRTVGPAATASHSAYATSRSRVMLATNGQSGVTAVIGLRVITASKGRRTNDFCWELLSVISCRQKISSKANKSFFSPFLQHRNGGLPAGRRLVRSSIRTSLTKRTIIYNEQTVGPRGSIFCTLMHVDKIPLPADFHPNGHVLDLYVQGQRFELNTLGSSNVIISQTVADRTNIAIANTESRIWPFDWHIYIWP